MRTYRARSSYVWGWLAVATGIGIAATAGVGSVNAAVGLGAAIAAAGIAAFLRPRVAIADDHVEVRNIVTTDSMPFARLARVETRWSLELVGDDDRTVGAFAAPAPGALQSVRLRRDAATTGDSATAAGGAGELPGTPSGDSAAMVREAWEAWRGAHPDAAADATGASSRRTVDPLGAALVALAVAGVAWLIFG